MKVVSKNSAEDIEIGDPDRFIIESIGEAALYEQLAEECVELAHASLKKARILRGENPTPVTSRLADGNIDEEVADVMLVIDILKLNEKPGLRWNKLDRWIYRILNKD